MGSPDDRRAALRRYDILDTPADSSFDRFTQHAADLFEAPIALLSLVDADRQVFKSCVGWSRRETPLDHSFCVHALDDAVMVVEDTREDSRFATNPLVTEEGVRFYAGAPLRTPEGIALGTLCVLDTTPRSFAAPERERLRTLADMAMDKLEDRRRRHLRDRELRRHEAQLRAITEHFPNGVVALFDENLQYELIRGEVMETLGLSPSAMEGRRLHDIYDATTAERLAPHFRQALQGTSSTFKLEYQGRLYRIHTVPVDGNPPRGLLMSQDITEPATHRRQLETVIDNLPGFVYRHRNAPGWPLEFVKGSPKPILGYSADEMETRIRDAETVIHPDDRSYVRETTAASLEESNTYDLTYRVVTKTDEVRWIWDRGKQVEDPVTGDTYLEGFITDITERKEAEEAARERTERLRGLANSIPGVVYQFYARPNGEKGVRFVSESATSILGLSPDRNDFYEAFMSRIPAPHRAEHIQSVEEALATESAWAQEFPYDSPSGDRIWLLGQSVPMESDGDEQVYNGVVLDITERKRAERALRENERQIRGLANSIPGLLFQFQAMPDAEKRGRLTYVSQQIDPLLGLPADQDELFDAILERIPDTHRDQFLASIDAAIRDEAVWDQEFPYDHPTRDRLWLRASAHPDRSKDDLIYNGVLLDVTQQHAADRERRVLAAAIEQANEAVLITEGAPLDPPGPRIVYANPAFETMTGYRVDDVIGRTPRILQGPDTDRAVLDRIREHLINKQPVRAETVNYHKDGTPYIVRWIIAPVRSEDGTAEYWVSVQRDVTDQRRREDELRTAKDEAEQAARLKEALLANMSHEIRTPLTSMIGFSEMLIGDLDGRAAEFASLINQSGQRLQNTLESVLQLAKLEGGAYDLSREVTDLSVLAQSVVRTFRMETDLANLALETEFSNRPVRADVDEQAVQEIISNLIDNAIKFTPEGGHVWVRSRPTADRAIIEVEDTGIGIADEALPAVFEAFKQESEGFTREYEGSGLGLSVAHQLTQRMDGTIEIESTKGEGTRCIVRFPRITASGSSSQPASNGMPGTQRS